MADNSTRGGVTFLELLLLLLIGLKLTGVITWSWWLVFLPLWIGLAISLLVMALLLVAFIVTT